MACLLALILAATVLTVPSGGNKKLLANAARASPAEAFWRAALPGASMPEAIRELLHPHAGDKATVLNKDDDVKLKDGGDDPPPMNFNYDDYRLASSRRNENTAPPSAEVLKHATASAENAATSPMAFLLEEDVRVVPFRSIPQAAITPDAPAAGLDPLRLYTVRVASEAGSSFVVRRDDADVTYVCHAKTARASAAGGRGDGESPAV